MWPGRKRVYWMVAAIMIVGALGSAVSPSLWVLIVFRFVLGFGVDCDYPVSAVMMSEYANRKDRGKLVGMVFITQALGLIVGPLIALALLGGGASDDTAWRDPARPRRGARRRSALPAHPDAGIAPIPGAGARADSAGGDRDRRLHQRAGQRRRVQRATPGDRAADVPDQPPVPDPAGRDSRHLVPARLRLLREHNLHPADPRPDLTQRLHHDQDRASAGHLRRRGGDRPCTGDRPAGPDRATGGCSCSDSR
jgi:hypothetical protein